MGWRFRRSIKIAPGVRWNLGLRGSSISVGGRGFTVNFSKRGVRRTVSIPGTGISHSTFISNTNRSRRRALPTPPAPPPVRKLPTGPFIDPAVPTAPLTDQRAIRAAAQWAGNRFPIMGASLAPSVTAVRRVEALRPGSLASSVTSRPEKVRVEYTLANRVGLVEIESWSGVVRPVEGADEPFRALRWRLRGGWMSALVVGYILCGWFASRHWYYEDHPTTGLLMLTPLALAAAMFPPILRLSRPKERRSSWGVLASAIPLAAICIGQTVAVLRAGPSLSTAHELSQTDVPKAMRVARAVWELRGDPAAAKLHDDLQLAILEEHQEPARLWPQLEKASFITSEARQSANRIAVDLTSRTAARMQEHGEHKQSLILLAGVPAPFRDDVSLKSRAMDAHFQEVSNAWSTIRSKRPLRERLAACSAIAEPQRALGPMLRDRGGPHEKQIISACELVERGEAARQKKEVAAARAVQLAAERAEKTRARR